jgi:hypothetical protein
MAWNWTKFESWDKDEEDYFGYGVAISANGSVLAIGEGGDTNSQGRVRVFSGTSWATQTTLTASDAANSDYFGYGPVAISGDGSVIVVGADREDGAGSNCGAAYVYYGTNWGTELKLTASDASNNSYFGGSVAISADGSVIIVGADSVAGGGTNRGAAYVYYGTTWGTEKILTASDSADNDNFGNSVSLDADGSIALVGAHRKNSYTGAAYVYYGTTWGTEKKLTATDGASSDWFGRATALSANGTEAVVGAPRETGGQGQVYVYSGTTWGTEKILAAPDRDTDYFGQSVAIDNNLRIAIGSTDYQGWENDPENPGDVYLYPYSGGTWSYGERIEAPEAETDDLYMAYDQCLAVSSNGSYILAGCPQWDGDGYGRAYLFYQAGGARAWGYILG